MPAADASDDRSAPRRIEPWTTLGHEPQGDYRVFSVRQDLARSPETGREHDFYVIESSDWINVIPMTPDGQIVCVRQFRHGTKEITLEVPGGMIDPEDDGPMAAGLRELREETGYTAERIVNLGAIAPNPALQNNRCYSALALGARPEGAQRLDGAEEIEVVLVDPEEVPGLVARGVITHALVVVAFYLFEHYVRAHPDVLGQG